MSPSAHGPLQAHCVERILDRLNKYHCQRQLQRLVELGANRNELLWRLIQLADYSPSLEPQKPKPRETRLQAKRIRATANLVESLNKGPYINLGRTSWVLPRYRNYS